MKTLNVSKECPRWMYEAFRALEANARSNSIGLQSIDRGESPFSGGNPLGGVIDHGQLLGLSPDDDHDQYALLRGRVGGQILNGGTLGSSPAAWGNVGDFMSDSHNSSSSLWTTTTADASASVGDIIVLGLVTSAFVNNTTGTSNYHSTITDTQGNTWTKLYEYHYCPDAFLNGECSSLWVCRVATAMTISVDTLTVTLTNAAVKKAISSHRFSGTSGATVSLTTSTVLTEFGASPLPPTSQAISGLTAGEYLYVRLTGISRGSIGTPVSYTPSSGYTEFFSTVALEQSAQAAGSQGVCSFTEYLISTGTGSTTDPTTSETFPYCTSIMVALSLTSTSSDGPLTLRAYNSTGPSSITLEDQDISEYFTNHYFYAVGGTDPTIYIRGSDGAIIGDTATTDPGTGKYLYLIGFNNEPISGTTGITSRAAEVVISTDVVMYTDNLQVFERSTDYTSGNGFQVATGLGFANVTNYGKLTVNGMSGGSGTLFDHNAGGLTTVDVTIRKRASQSGNMTEWQNESSTVMSYIRPSDGAFVGPVVVTGSDTHTDDIFKIVDSVDTTKGILFEVAGVSTGTVKLISFPDTSGYLVLSSTAFTTPNRILYVSNSSGLAADASLLAWDQTNARLGVGTTSPQAPLHVGAYTHSGGAIYDGIIEGRLLLGNQFQASTAFVAGRALDIRHSIGSNVGITFINIQPNLGNVSNYSGNFFAVSIQPTGTPGGTTGSYVYNTLRILSSGTIVAAGATCSDAVALSFQATPVEGSGTISNYTGGDFNLQGTATPRFISDAGATTNGTTTLTVASTTGISAGWWINPGSMTTIPVQTTVVSIDSGTTLTMSNAATGSEGPSTCVFQPFGTDIRAARIRLSARAHAMTNLVGFKFEAPSSSYAMVKNVAYIWSNALIADTGLTTNWSFIKHDITAVNATAIWALDFTSTNNSRHAGKLSLGKTTAPTSWLELGAGTTTVAPIIFTSGTNLTTAIAGGMEFTTDDFFLTITTGAARKGIVLDDGARLTAGRVPFATTNGRLIDDADMTFSVDTLTVTKIGATSLVGDISFVGSGVGLPYGSCYGNEIAWSQATAAQNTWYLVSDTDMADGQLNNVTHDGSGKLTVSVAGRYKIDYALSFEGSVANEHYQSGIAVNGTTQNDGINHVKNHPANDATSMGGTAILNLAANDTVEISMRTTDAGTPTLTVDHLNITLVQVGG